MPEFSHSLGRTCSFPSDLREGLKSALKEPSSALSGPGAAIYHCRPAARGVGKILCDALPLADYAEHGLALSSPAAPLYRASASNLFAIVKRIVDAKAQFRSLAGPWADTDTSTGRLGAGGTRMVERDLNPRPNRRRQEPRQGPRKAHGQAPLRPQRKEAIRRSAQGREAARIGAQLQCK